MSRIALAVTFAGLARSGGAAPPPRPASRAPLRPVAPPPPAPPRIDPDDWHIPSLDEVFRLARSYPGKKIFLDSKVSNDPAVARRLARQYIDLLRKHPDMRDRVIVSCPDSACLDAMKEEFARCPDFQDFRAFCLDNEHLNDRGVGGHTEKVNALDGAGDNQYIAIGDPRDPLRFINGSGTFDDLKREVQEALAHTRDPRDPAYGKKLVVWTINDESKMDELARLGPDGIMTDNPELLNRVLDRHYGPSGQDPRRPAVYCHRGGPDTREFPENTMPMIQRGLELGDAIEIDLCAAKDGCIVFHDNDIDAIAVARNAGLEGAHFRPVQPDLGSEARGKRLDQMTMAEIRASYGYERNPTTSLIANGIASVARHALRLPGTVFNFLGRFLRIGDFRPLTWLGNGLNWVADKVFTPVLDTLTRWGDAAVNWAAGAVKSIGKAVSGFFKSIFG
jgi:glycerophosphoryl diester phosphodiesterase